MNPNIPNNIDNSGFIGSGYSNLQPLPNINLNTTTNYLNDPTMFTYNSQSPFLPPTETSRFDIQITITQYQQRILNNTIMFSNATETSTSFSFVQSTGNFAQFMSPPPVSVPETLSFEISGFKIKIAVVPIFNQQDQQYVITNYPRQQNQ